MSEEQTEKTTDLPIVARANLGSLSRQTGEADGVLGAFQDLSKNRLPLPKTVRVHNARKAVEEAIQERDELKVALIRQYDESGEGWEDPTDAPLELLEKIQELMAEPVELDLGEPVVLNGEAAGIELSGQSYQVLTALGFLEIQE